MRSPDKGGWTAGRLDGWLALVGPVLLVALTALAIWPTSPRRSAIVRTYARSPSAVQRDSLAALAATGATVRWRGTVQPMAMELDTDNTGAVRVAVAAPAGTIVHAADALGTLDSSETHDGSVAFNLHGVISPLAVSVGGDDLRSAVQRPRAKAVAILGPAGWEARFLIEALEAAGLPVAARLRVGPQTWVTQGRALPLDTAQHSVAVVLGGIDRQAADQLRSFARSGGGVVLAAGASGLEDLAPGRFGTLLRPPASLSLPGRREHLVSRPITRLNASAVALEVTDTRIKTAVRRVGAGRVVQLAEEDTWRLVLASDAGRAAHANLWLPAIALTSPRDIRRPIPGDDVAPRAALVAALGPAAGDLYAGPTVDWEWTIGLLLFATLLAEWAVRRLGGRA